MKQLLLITMFALSAFADESPSITDAEKVALLSAGLQAANARIASLVKENEMIRFNPDIGAASCAVLTSYSEYQKLMEAAMKKCGGKLNEKNDCEVKK